MKLRNYSIISIFTMLLFFTSCYKDDVEPKGEAFGIRHDKLLSEYEAVATNEIPYNTADYPDFSSVICFTYSLDGSSNPDYVASGVLVDSNWILTAGHNFFIGDLQENPALVSGISIIIGNDPSNPDQVVTAEELVFHPTWLDNSVVIENANDFCLVKLSSAVTGITPAKLFNSSDELINNTVWHCGFGDYTMGSYKSSSDFSKKHAIENKLDRKVSGIMSTNQSGNTYNGGLVAFDFDSPNGNINSLGDSYTSSDEPLLGGGSSDADALEFEGTTIEGDSGGPLFVKFNDQWMVIGILSGGADYPIEDHVDGSYGDISVYTRVSTSMDWIDSVIK